MSLGEGLSVSSIRVVLTGSPCSGKTSLIRLLECMGYSVINEAARMVWEKYHLHPVRDFIEFQARIFELQKDLERNHSDVNILFRDRSAIDSIAYYRCADRKVPQELHEYCRVHRYDRVFLLDPLPFLESDGLRSEDWQRRILLDSAIEKAYQELGYDIVRVPVATIQERLRAILSHLLRCFPWAFNESSISWSISYNSQTIEQTVRA